MFKKAKAWALKTLAVLILAGFFAGWIFIAGAVYELYMLKAVQAWPVQRGVITHSYVSGSGYRKRNNLRVMIAGLYFGTDQKFAVSRVGYGFEHSVWTRDQAQRTVAQYPVKLELEIYHQPGKPGQAILVRGNSALPTWLALGFGFGLVLLPLGLYGYGRWRERRLSQNKTMAGFGI